MRPLLCANMEIKKLTMARGSLSPTLRFPILVKNASAHRRILDPSDQDAENAIANMTPSKVLVINQWKLNWIEVFRYSRIFGRDGLTSSVR